MAGLRTVIVGFGRIAAGYAADPRIALHYPVATHAQALAGHPAFAWDAVVDPDPRARALALDMGIATAVATTADLPDPGGYRVAVLATPPHARADVLEGLPNLRAVVVEKPVGATIREAAHFLDVCRKRGVMVQVNYWRRADPALRGFAGPAMADRLGRVQAVSGVYGNGLRNNASHMVDWLRFWFGDVAMVQALGAALPLPDAPLPDDCAVPFALRFRDRMLALIHTLDFGHYREVGLDVWGTKGHLAVMQGGLVVRVHRAVPHRALSGALEVARDDGENVPSGAGMALRHLYDNLASALEGSCDLWSPGEEALASEAVIDAVLASAAAGGTPISFEGVP